MSSSSSSYQAALPEPSPSPPAGVGLGYGIAIAVGILVLVSTIMLASYVCVRVKGGHPRRPMPSPSLPVSRDPIPGAAAADSPALPHAAVMLGLEAPAIEAFYPKFSYGGGADAPAGPCPICLGEYEDGETLRRAPDCGHCFHAGCVGEWLRVSATCPLCRSSPVPSASATPAVTPMATPLSELIPLAAHAR